tara:strand:- start:2928 stop:3167 length:240 start_codon:yes stop_codon:yes gene_type:complete
MSKVKLSDNAVLLLEYLNAQKDVSPLDLKIAMKRKMNGFSSAVYQVTLGQLKSLGFIRVGVSHTGITITEKGEAYFKVA